MINLRQALEALIFCKVSIFFEKTGCQYSPTGNIDETGRRYLEKINPKMLKRAVTKIVPTAFGYANVFIYEDEIEV